MPHGGGESPGISFHIVTLHCVQLVGAIVASHYVDVIAQRTHPYKYVLICLLIQEATVHPKEHSNICRNIININT